MASEGPRFPGTMASVLETGDDNAWVNPGNVAADDGAEAQVTDATFDANDQTAALRCSTFGFGIPSDATIDGVIVEVEQRRFAGAARDHQVQLFSSPGTLIGNNKATATAWPATATIASYGGAADAWGASLTPAIVNASTFGVSVKAFATSANTDVGIDFVRLTIHYTPAASPGEASTISVGVDLTSTTQKAGAGTAILEAGGSLTTPGAKLGAAIAILAAATSLTTLGAKVGADTPILIAGVSLPAAGAKVGQDQPGIAVGVALTTLGQGAAAPGEASLLELLVGLTTIDQKVGAAQSLLSHGVLLTSSGAKAGPPLGRGPLGVYMGHMRTSAPVAGPGKSELG